MAGLALLVLGIRLRAGTLGPSSLWLDDAWAALIARADTPHEVFLMGVTAPGFGLLLKGWLAVAGTSSPAAQALPFVFGLLGAPLVYLVGLRFHLRPTAALLGAVLVAIAPAHVTYSTAVKHYTAELVAAMIVLRLAWRVIERSSEVRRWAALTVAATLAILLSAALAVVAWAAMATVVIAHRVERKPLRPALVAVSALGVFSAAFYLLVLQGAVNELLLDFWRAHYIPLNEGFARFVRLTGGGAVQLVDGFTIGPPLVALLFLLAATVVVAIRRWRLALLLLLPIAGAFVLAMLKRAPIGGGRTDIYLYGSLALIVAAAVHEIGARWPQITAWVAVVATVTLAFLGHPRSGYPMDDIRPLVITMEDRVRAGDGVLVYHVSNFPYGLYTRFAIDIVESKEYATGFAVRPRRRNTVVLPFEREDPERYRPVVARLAARFDHLWVIASRIAGDLPRIERMLREAGFREHGRWHRPGAMLSEWRADGAP